MENKKISLGKTTDIHPKPALVIGSYDEKGVPNIMTASWAGICNSDPVCIAVSLRPATLSYHNITKNMAFTVNVPGENLVKIVDYAGVKSGHDENKFEKLGLTPVEADSVYAPYVEEFPLVLECKVIKIIDIGSHRQFIGEVMDTKADPSVLDDRGRVDVTKLKPISWGGRGYWGLGDFMGKPWNVYKELEKNP
ncbi:MAG: flavin reductase family protein [Candidatus Marinimicrobia bacterium]|nr:flavin reductase family protein [Candidatus Neomarinimicrobiota bacterium]